MDALQEHLETLAQQGIHSHTQKAQHKVIFNLSVPLSRRHKAARSPGGEGQEQSLKSGVLGAGGSSSMLKVFLNLPAVFYELYAQHHDPLNLIPLPYPEAKSSKRIRKSHGNTITAFITKISR
jgi:hypothetical protein